MSAESSVDVDAAKKCRLFPCPEEGCVKALKQHSSLVKHLDCGKHKHTLEHETLFDKAMIEYAINLECGASKCPTVLERSRPSLSTIPTTVPMQWALKSSQSRRRKFTENQKQYLNAKFQIEERTGKKANPTEVSKATRTEKDNNGESLFSYGDFLTSQQISNYFSRLAAK